MNVTDERDPDNIQFNILSILNSGTDLLLNQYGKVFTKESIGEFDLVRGNNFVELSFYPTDGRVNDYTYSFIAFDVVNDFNNNFDSFLLGDLVQVGSYKTTVDNLSNIFELSSNYTSLKMGVQLSFENNYQFDEINITRNSSDILLTNYATVFSGPLITPNVGLGTYAATIANNKLVINFLPNENISGFENYTFDISYVSIANTNFSTNGKKNIRNIQLESRKTVIEASNNPEPVGVGSHGFEYQSSYYIAQCTDLTNNKTQLSEIIVLNDRVKSYSIEFANLFGNDKIGEFSSLKTLDTELIFTPKEDIDVEVVIYQQKISSILEDGLSESEINLDNIIISSGLSRSGVDGERVTSFNLTHFGTPIFERIFNGGNSDIVNINDNTILIPKHFFTTGEKIKYYSNEFDINDTENSIEIQQVNVPGIGFTNKLPKDVYVVKINDLKIKLAKSAEDALKIIPQTLEITSLGGNNVHKFVCEKQNAKSLISIDNIIQSPIITTNKIAELVESLDDLSFELKVNDEKLFVTGDIISVNNEYMRVFSVGVGSTNSLIVRRNILGTIRESHQSGSLVTILQGNYNIVNNILFFTSAPYGLIPEIKLNDPFDEKDYKGLETTSTFDGRIFLRSGVILGDEDAYHSNYLFDNITEDFNGVNSDFILTSEGQDITGISSDNSVILINNIYQSPEGTDLTIADGSYYLSEFDGQTKINFVGAGISNPSDVNTSSIPYGGVIVSVGSAGGIGYQPIVSAGGTAIISIDGTISSISIGNSGSGYRVGIQTIVNVGIQTYSSNTPNIKIVGIASIVDGHVTDVVIINPGSGYDPENPPEVVFDSPIGYTNIPLIYSENSQSGIGTQATIDLYVGEDGKVLSFDLKNYGYGYEKNDILTVDIGGNTGIPTFTNNDLLEFNIIVDRIYDSKFSGWSMGQFEVLDNLDSKFNGKNRNFQITLEGKPISISKKKSSPIQLEYVLLVFINDILQIPFKNYIFTGSIIRFIEPPKGRIDNPPYSGDKSKIIFYKGTRDIDVQEIDVLDAPKVGDNLTIKSDVKSLTQKPRIIELISAIDVVDTNKYSDAGISFDETLLRPTTWCKQRDDLYIFGNPVTKDRKIYEPYINPITNILKNVSSTDSEVFVESVNLFFNYAKENINEKKLNIVEIIDNTDLLSAEENSLVVENFQDWNKDILPKYEMIDNVKKYEGDFGIIVGITSDSIPGFAQTCLLFDLFIPLDSYLRDIDINSGISTTGISGIQTGYRFVISGSTIGNSNSAYDIDGNLIRQGDSFIDNVYECLDFTIQQVNVPGIGVTNVTRVITSVNTYSGLTPSNFNDIKYYGNYSWGRIEVPFRKFPKDFNVTYSENTSNNLIIRRKNSLRYDSYLP